MAAGDGAQRSKLQVLVEDIFNPDIDGRIVAYILKADGVGECITEQSVVVEVGNARLYKLIVGVVSTAQFRHVILAGSRNNYAGIWCFL